MSQIVGYGVAPAKRIKATGLQANSDELHAELRAVEAETGVPVNMQNGWNEVLLYSGMATRESQEAEAPEQRCELLQEADN